jgi:hypothetical protein
MTAAQRLLGTIHAVGHTLLVTGEASVYTFSDTYGDALPDWVRGEVAALIPELIELCRDVACARCGRPEMVPVEGLVCAGCYEAPPPGQPPRRPDAHA